MSAVVATPIANAIPWISGLRDDGTNDDWARHVSLLVLGDFHAIPQGPRTIQAEAGLGIPASKYWYVGRSEKKFGHGVFWCEASTSWTPDERGVCPFDTGGLWHDRIRTTAPLSDDSKKSLFETHDRNLVGWDVAIRTILKSQYISFADYVRGQPPPALCAGFRAWPDNQPPAWTWEARVPTSRADKVTRARLYLTSEDQEFLLNWLDDRSGFDLARKVRATEWIMDNSRTCTILVGVSTVVQADLVSLYLW